MPFSHAIVFHFECQCEEHSQRQALRQLCCYFKEYYVIGYSVNKSGSNCIGKQLLKKKGQAKAIQQARAEEKSERNRKKKKKKQVQSFFPRF